MIGELGHTLRHGTAIGYWQVGTTAEARYDVADQPMQGEMDPFFFLTKDRNFIPHEYPCRTRFAADHRGRRPAPQGRFEPHGAWLPFGAPRLDLSGFWFRPTHLATWARSVIRSEAAGPARVRLATPGGAVLFVNGVEAGWMAPYTRNKEAVAEVVLPLVAGDNEITVFFDDLAERDARYYIALTWIDGPDARQVSPFAAPPATVAAVEATLSAMHFDRPAYGEGEVAVALPVPLPAAAAAQITVAGDFMSHNALRICRDVPAGTTRLVLGQVEDFPADFRLFRIALTVAGFTASRVLGVEIVHGAGQEAGDQPLAARIDAALAHVADHGEADCVRALARLAAGRDPAPTEAMIAAALPAIEDCWDCADFELVPLLWLRMRYGDALSAPLRARIDAAILGYRYWMDEPGNDVQWYFSENHALLFHTSAYLGGTLLPGARFIRSGRTGRDQAGVGAARLRAWLDHFEAWEMAEFNSAPYFPIDLKGLCTLYALAPDADIRERAGRGVLRLVELVANSAHQGVLTAAQGRSYEHTLRAGLSLELSAIGRLVWGRGRHGARFHALPQLALCLRDHGLVLPETLAQTALWQKSGGQEWCFSQGESPAPGPARHGFAALYHYKTRDWAMGSAAAYRWGEWGYQETLIHARLGEEAQAQVWINHPGELIHSGYSRPSYWGGSASVPRVQQYRGLAILMFEGNDEQSDFTHAWFPAAIFDATLLDGRTAVAKAGKGYVLLRGDAALEQVATGPTAGCELRLAGRRGCWILRLGSSEAGPAEIARRHAGLAMTDLPGGAVAVTDADYGRVLFHADGRIEAEGRLLDPATWTVAGERHEHPETERFQAD